MDIAAAIAFLASDDAGFITGAVLPVDGGTTAQTNQPDLRQFISQGKLPVKAKGRRVRK